MMTEQGTFCQLCQTSRKRLLDHTGIKEQEFKTHQVMAYKHQFLVTQLSGRVFQMIHWLKLHFRLRKLLRWRKRVSSVSTDMRLTTCVCSNREGGDPDRRHCPSDCSRRCLRSPSALEGKINHAPAVQRRFGTRESCRLSGTATASSKGRLRARQPAEGRNCPSALKQKREG